MSSKSFKILNAQKLIGLLSTICFFLLWELIVVFSIYENPFLPPPSEVFKNLYELLLLGDIFVHIEDTLKRVFIGYVIAVLIGISLAILCNTYRIIEYIITPITELIRGIAPLALLPLFMLIFGIGTLSKVMIIFWVSWVPIFINALQGMKEVDPLLIKVAKSFGSPKIYIIFDIIIPSALPYLITGLRLAMGSAFLVLVAAEMIGSNSGLGFYIIETSQTFKLLDMYSAIFLIGIISISINWFFVFLNRTIVPWGEMQDGDS